MVTALDGAGVIDEILDATMEEVDKVAKPLIESARKGGANLLKVAKVGGAVLTAVYELTFGAPSTVSGSEERQLIEQHEQQQQLSEQNAEKRKSSEQIRKEYEERTGKPWPKDSKGKNKDVHHKKPKADGGSDNLRNIEPRSRTEHLKLHKDRGDFQRWGKRSEKKKQQKKKEEIK